LAGAKVNRAFESDEENDYVIHVSGKTIMENSGLLIWGLNEKLLAIVENYIDLPPLFFGTTICRDVANDKQMETRHWHLDSEDSRIVKIIIYLEDVETNDGPFTYIPLEATRNHKFEVFDGNQISDVDMTRIISGDLQIEGTMVGN
jgi:hypothetical protein